MQYTQKQSYFLQKNGYKLSKNSYTIDRIHASEDKVFVAEVHIWKVKFLRKQFFTNKIGWISIPSGFIETYSSDRLSSNYFQTDDMYYSVELRRIYKHKMEELINYIKENIS